jgi:hypothetical protein
VADTPEGPYCLTHYMELESCHKCRAAASQCVDNVPVCARCQDKDIEVVLVRSSLSGHDEVSGHDLVGRMGDDLRRGLSRKLAKAGYKARSCWTRGKQLDK